MCCRHHASLGFLHSNYSEYVKEEISTRIVEATLFTHHAKTLTRESASHQINVRKSRQTLIVICERRDIAHFNFVGRVKIRFVCINCMTLNFRERHAFEGCGTRRSQQLHGNSKPSKTRKQFYVIYSHLLMESPIALASFTGTAFPICPYQEFCAP